MSAEILGAFVAKWLWAPFTAWLLFVHQRREKRMDDLVKQSNDSQVRITTLKQEVDILKETLRVFLERNEKMLNDISDIKTSVAVIQNNVEHLKEGK